MTEAAPITPGKTRRVDCPGEGCPGNVRVLFAPQGFADPEMGLMCQRCGRTFGRYIDVGVADGE